MWARCADKPRRGPRAGDCVALGAREELWKGHNCFADVAPQQRLPFRPYLLHAVQPGCKRKPGTMQHVPPAHTPAVREGPILTDVAHTHMHMHTHPNRARHAVMYRVDRRRSGVLYRGVSTYCTYAGRHKARRSNFVEKPQETA